MNKTFKITSFWDINFYFNEFQFEKPGRRDNFDYPDMALEAGMLKLYSVNRL